MTPSRIHVTEVVLRDGHQSLIATRLRTEDMLPICPQLDQVGFWSIEVWGGATFDACVRFLKEDPWERLRQLKAALPRTPLQMLLRGQNLLGYRPYSDDVVRAFVHRAAANGIGVFRLFDALNDLRNLRVVVEAVLECGQHAQGALCYTVSPVHTLEHFVAQARELERMGCHSLCIKDMAGLLTPARAAALFAALGKTVSLPLHLHSHASVGVAPISLYQAVQHGARHIDTAISPFSGGTSHAATESMVVAFHDTPYDTGLDLELLQAIGFYFHEVRKKYHAFESEFTGIDTRVQINQVPGGMMSNLSHQLKGQGALHRMPEVLAEIPRVREDLGYPPLVTPTSQIVGTQAVLNVLTGERYKSLTNEVKLYLEGRYGRAPGPINEEVRLRAIGDEEVITCRPADKLAPEMHRLRDEIGEIARTEEDILTYAMFPEVGRQFLQERAAGTLKPEPLPPPPEQQGTSAPRLAPTDFNVTVHGETYHIRVTGVGHRSQAQRPFYVSVDGVPEEILVETLAEVVPSEEGGGELKRSKGSPRPRASGPGQVASAMPGSVVEVRVKVGDAVQAGDAVVVIEAMKMEYPVAAPIGGTVKAVYVAKGESVSPGEALVEIE
jgi:pyruvate carboxylase subunit B